MKNPKFQIDLSKNNKHYFRLKARNGEIILASEMYEQKAGAKNGIESVIEHSPHDKNYIRLHSVKQEPFFVLRADNYEVIGVSEMYSSEQAMETGIASVKTVGPTAPTEDLTD